MAVRIDGSYGEGGGQILRTSIALSALLGKPVEIVNIRAKRANPGLQPQHLTGVSAAALLTDAEVEGAAKGSTRLFFKPKALKCGTFNIDIGTAGSISLVVQTLAPILLYAPCPTKLVITGGTDVAWAPPIDYMRFVFARYLTRFGARIAIELVKRGHYPRGGGKAVVQAEPAGRLRAVDSVEFGRPAKIAGVSHAVNLPPHVAERQARAAREALAKLGYAAEVEVEARNDGLGPGSGVVLWAESDVGNVVGGDALGERGKPAEEVGREAAEKLAAVLKAGASLDPHMADMVVLYMALAQGRSRLSTTEATMHLQTNIYIVEQFLPVKFKLERAGPRYIIEVEGVGYP
ncbi:RNA 3'-terminal phosphate cyclase [Pyrobaculum neutrophilum]|uniref:RNA 3'-terminal phosphate cyclase n=1 Tax=Pyrobaculum neutrophilum (strain DSM 2338 / JCM 9278 / NBRC 100436 / V24Sta) TaxID=444157 RepID=RTCA_PYRNV|nr:RNA 3'-terminal phosphate cyclase [Pyrobaculum neutrophilum]B1YDJ1.1 RecName: Full=RNA 3'-terminal phosphate cyclase; Short=RNA cyclase; Short=RNA-3'-phosphate cyclase [Pyrobaculum neutrophilum V24Sta]ACB39854.1 RNA 3'-phosphate cyclase [Pyrobaculum neutrophilum V24Sta]